MTGGPRLDVSMRVRILWPLVAAVVALALVVLVGLPWRLQRVAEEWSVRRAVSLSQFVGESVKSGLDFRDAEFVATRLSALQASPDVRFAVVFEGGGQPLASFGSVPPLVPEGSGAPTTRHDAAGLVVEVPLVARGGASGVLLVGFSNDELNEAWRRDGEAAVLLAALTVAIGSALVWAFGSSLARPLSALTRTLERSAPSELAAEARRLLPARRYLRDERLVLTQAVAEMADRLATQIQKADAERRRALSAEDEALRASRTKSQFLANMSHELRTPLNAVIGYGEMLLELEDLPVEAIQDVERILRSAHHLLDLINDLLDLAKIEAEKMDLFPSRFAVAGLVEGAVASVRHLVEKNRNALSVELGPELGEAVCDALRLRQCLFNLLSNAAKFTEDGTVRLTVERRGSELRFVVADSGIGMDQTQLGRLFQPFTQLDTSPTRVHGGTGLGLALTRHLSKMLGGEVTVVSELGRGSTFTLTLPDGLA